MKNWGLVFLLTTFLFFSVTAFASEENDTRKYGRFQVMKMPDGSTAVFGGVFVPPKRPQEFFGQEALKNFLHVVLVNYEEKTLEYYRDGMPVVGYAVVTPEPSFLPKNEIIGKVKRIVKNPVWCPTPNIRREYPDLPKGCLPPRHLQNAMGSIKFEISWQEVKGWETIRLHGASGYPANFWAEKTFGCIRLQNTAIESLVEKLGEKAVEEGVAIVVYRP